MPRPLPSYEQLVRWTVSDVIDWLQEARLAEFRDQFVLGNIDGRHLAGLTEFDINNFIGKSKLKHELTTYVMNIKRSKSSKSKPDLHFKSTNNINHTFQDEDTDDDSDTETIYSNASSDEDYLYPTGKQLEQPKVKPSSLNFSSNKRSDNIRSPISPTERKLKAPPKETAKHKSPKHERPPMPVPTKESESKPAVRRRTPPPIPVTEPNMEDYANVTAQVNSKRKHRVKMKVEPAKDSEEEEETPAESPVSNHKVPLPPVPKMGKRTITVNRLQSLDAYSWYYGEMDRKKADEMLKEECHNGMFILRKSLKGGSAHPYTLMVYYEARTYNFPVSQRESDGKFSLGKQSAERKSQLQAFDSVDELITHFKVNPIINIPNTEGNYTGILTKPLPKL